MPRRMHSVSRWLLAGVLLLGARAVQAQERTAPRPQVVGIFKSAAMGKITVNVAPGERGRETREGKESTYALTKDVEVATSTREGLNFGRGVGVVFKEIKLDAIAPGARVFLTLSADEKEVESILAEGTTIRGRLKEADAAKKSVTLELPSQERERGAGAAGEQKTYALAPGAEIALDDGRGSRFSLKEGKLTDLGQGSVITARLTPDLKMVQSLIAEGVTYQGTIKEIDAEKKSLTLVVRPMRGDDAGEEHQLVLASDALVVIDDGRGRRLSLKESKLADVPVGSAALVRLSADQSLVTQLRAEGPTVFGMLKGVDASKHVLVFAVPRARGEEPDEKILTVAKDARIFIDGAASSLADLKVGENPMMLMLRLSLDQKSVQAVMARQNRER